MYICKHKHTCTDPQTQIYIRIDRQAYGQKQKGQTHAHTHTHMHTLLLTYSSDYPVLLSVGSVAKKMLLPQCCLGIILSFPSNVFM